MEHHNLEDNALSEQWGGGALIVAAAFTARPIRHLETHFGLSWQKMQMFEAGR